MHFVLLSQWYKTSLERRGVLEHLPQVLPPVHIQLLESKALGTICGLREDRLETIYLVSLLLKSRHTFPVRNTVNEVAACRSGT